MKNISRNPSSLENYQLSFDDLVGDNITFFNKDLDTPNSFGLRKSKIEHPDDCECFKCEDGRTRDR